jgi:hypothetical protein
MLMTRYRELAHQLESSFETEVLIELEPYLFKIY